MTKSFVTILVFAIGAAQTAQAKHAYFSQQCAFTLDGATHVTSQNYFGDRFTIDGVGAEYIAANTSAITAEQDIAVTMLDEKDGPKEATSDGEFTTETWTHEETIVIRKVSPKARAELGYKLEVGDRLSLTCQNQVDEP